MSIDICKELSQNFIDFSYEANSERAFPDVRDGLKPGQRACLWEMFSKGYSSNKPHVKSAKISGGTAATWWPHGTTAIYETFTRMSQDWINNIPEVDWHGANGNIVISAQPAADRYCVSGDTLIKTNIGTIPIKNLIPSNELEANLDNINIIDYMGESVPATKIFNSGKHPTKKLILKNGQELVGTYNHPIVILNPEDCSFQWKTLEELTGKEKVIIPAFGYTKDNDLVSTDAGDIEFKMLGSMVSEGYITSQSRIGINNTNIDLISPVKEYFITAGISNANINYNNKRKCYEYCFSNKEYYNDFINKYDYKFSAKEKVIPALVFTTSLSNKSAFLRYLFEGDGCVITSEENNRITYSSFSKELVKQLQIMLLQDFSIFSSITSSRKKTGIEYKLTITGRGLELFRQKINFVSERKQAILKQACHNYSFLSKIATNSYYTINEISEYVRTKNKNCYTIKHNFGNIKNFYLCKDYIDNFNYNRLKNLISNYLAIEIKSIQDDGIQEVYSVRVDNPSSEHSFIANGFINHNTEARLSKAVEDGMLYGIKKNTVPMQLNFSEDESWPEVLPAIFPRLMINGCQGIGVTIANYWEPNNLGEIVRLIETYIKDNTIDYKSIYPDFPSGGIIINKNELSEIYETGKGRIILRGKAQINDTTITITELPYQVYVEPFINEIKTLVEKEEINGIEDIFNKTDDEGLKIEIVCSKPPEKILKLLYKNTSLQKIYAPNHMALLGKTPKMFTLKDYFDVYINHNITCIKNEYNYDLNQAEKRYEIVSGLIKALDDIDTIINLIKKSKSSIDAQNALTLSFGFSEAQSKAIVDMRLGKLANLELEELKNEVKSLKNQIENCNIILSSEKELNKIFITRLKDFEGKYGFKRRTKIEQYVESDDESSIDEVEPEKCVVIMTESGYIKRITGDSFKPGKKGTKGIKTQDDITSAVIRTNTVDNLFVFSNLGKLYKLPVIDIPEGTATARGISIKMLVPMESNENASTIYSIYKDTDAEYIIFVTKNGIIKKTKLTDYINVRKGRGAPAINLKDSDKIVSVFLAKEEELILITKMGKALWCDSKAINAVGKNASGIRGMKLDADDIVISAIAVRDTTDKLAIFTTTGLGKRIDLSELSKHSHGGKGQIVHRLTKTSGEVAGIQMVSNDDLILLVGDKSSLCINCEEIPITKKTSIGNIMIKGNSVVKVSKV